jgi:hypothetical protein
MLRLGDKKHIKNFGGEPPPPPRQTVTWSTEYIRENININCKEISARVEMNETA